MMTRQLERTCFRIAVPLAFLLGAAACSTTGTTGTTGTGTAGTGTVKLRPEQLGAFECADRAKASPPKRILALGIVRGEKREIVRREGKPLLDVRPCPAGRVPV